MFFWSRQSCKRRWSRDGLEINRTYVSIGIEKVDKKLHKIMKDIHQSCVEHGNEDGSINYIKGANIAGFIK